MIHEWLQATDGNSASVRVFLFDYRKAFDFIDHGTLAAKLKGGEIRDTKTLNLSRNIVAFQVFGRCFSFFTLQDQLVAQQKHLLQVEEMQHADWLICLVWLQDGGITTNLLRDKLRV